MARKPSEPSKTKNSKASGQKTIKPEKSSPKLRSADNRIDHRVPVQLLVDYRAQGGHYLFDFCRDLGAGGVFIQTPDPLPKGSQIDLTFTLPDSRETLAASGEVIWVQPEVAGRKDLTPGMGVQFNGFRDEQRKTLMDFVSRYHGSRFETNSDPTKDRESVKKPA